MLTHIVLRLDAENVTVSVNFVGKLLAFQKIERILEETVHATHDQDQPSVLHTREVLKAIWDIETDLLSRYHNFRAFFLDIKRLLVEFLFPTLRLLLALLVFLLLLFVIR